MAADNSARFVSLSSFQVRFNSGTLESSSLNRINKMHSAVLGSDIKMT